MAGLARLVPEKGIALDFSAIVYIAPLKNNFGNGEHYSRATSDFQVISQIWPSQQRDNVENIIISLIVISQGLRLEIERKLMCALHSCIQNLENFHAFNCGYQSDRGFPCVDGN
jgi:hypothetical protein